jgi:hypothetical protein
VRPAATIALRAGVITAAATALVLGAVASPASADSSQQRFAVSFDESPSLHVGGLGTGCPAFTGTLSELRHNEIEGFVNADGTAHARTVATATITLVPDNNLMPSYTGSYASRQTGTFDDAGATDRVVTTTVQGVIAGTDGSTYGISELTHFSVDGQGTVRVWFDLMRCTPR